MINDILFKNIDGVRNFIWKDALWLSKWKVYAVPSVEQENEIVKIAFKLQQIRDFFGLAINAVSWLRPTAYNVLIGGATDSAHMYGMAVDFVVENVNCDEIRRQLLPKLDELKIRMEDRPGSNWVHIDNRDPGAGKRFFKP